MARRWLPPLDQLCPYCAAMPSIPCPDAVQGFLLGYVHATDREWPMLFMLDRLTTGLRDYAFSIRAPTL